LIARLPVRRTPAPPAPAARRSPILRPPRADRGSPVR